MPDYVPLTILDSRVAVPKDAHAAKIEPKQLVAIQDLPDVLDPDVLTTGEVNLMAQPVEERTSRLEHGRAVRLDRVSLCCDSADSVGPEDFPVSSADRCGNRRDNITDLYLPNDLKNFRRIPSPPQPKSRR